MTIVRPKIYLLLRDSIWSDFPDAVDTSIEGAYTAEGKAELAKAERESEYRDEIRRDFEYEGEELEGYISEAGDRFYIKAVEVKG